MVKKSLSGVTFESSEARKSLRSHFSVTFTFAGFGGFWRVPGGSHASSSEKANLALESWLLTQKCLHIDRLTAREREHRLLQHFLAISSCGFASIARTTFCAIRWRFPSYICGGLFSFCPSVA